MFQEPHDLDQESIAKVLAKSVNFDAHTLEYLPVGFGSHHWRATDSHGRELFLSVDDLVAGCHANAGIPNSVFAKLEAAYSAARELHLIGALEFVVSPLQGSNGSVLQRINERYSLAAYPLLNGSALEQMDDGQRSRVRDLIIRLHGASAVVQSIAATETGELPGKGALHEAIAAVSEPSGQGPYAARARVLLAAKAETLTRSMEIFNELAKTTMKRPERFVVTHGEPHPANIMLVADDLRLIDWDTCLLAPPERDLWVLDTGDGKILAEYTKATGVEVDRSALEMYRLWFNLSEVSGYLALFGRDHQENQDTAMAWTNLGTSFSTLEGIVKEIE